MVHIPSFLVGSVFSGGVFLLVHEKMSHRHRLSAKWPLREWAEKEFRAKWSELRSNLSSDGEAKSQFNAQSLSREWNKALSTVQDSFRKQ